MFPAEETEGVVFQHVDWMCYKAVASAHHSVICCKCEINIANIRNPFRQCNYQSALLINITGFCAVCNFTLHSHKMWESLVAIKKTSCDHPSLTLHHDLLKLTLNTFEVILKTTFIRKNGLYWKLQYG